MKSPASTARHGRQQDRVDEFVRRLGPLRRVVLVAWALAVLAAGVLSAGLPDLLSGGGWSVPGSQSARVAEDLSSGFTGRGATTVTLVIRDERGEAGEAPLRRARPGGRAPGGGRQHPRGSRRGSATPT
jgi:RND superfamily putative drug exporter